MIQDGALKSLMLLWQMVASEEAARCRTSTLRDYNTVTRRCEAEGKSFLTITLPAFGKDFERSLELGAVDRNLFTGFQWKAGLPRFLSGFLGQIFAVETGKVLLDPNVDAIRAVRQLTLMFGKIKLDCTPERVNNAMKGFIECEQQVEEADLRRTHDDYVGFHRISRLLWADVLAEADNKVYDGAVVPRHGPGATADRLLGNKKFRNRTWTERLEEYFPAGEFMFSGVHHYNVEYEHVRWIEPGAEPSVKVVPVPKTQKTPRIIAIEPSWMQYCQQGLREILYDLVERGDARSAFVGFTHQEPNQQLARKGSLSGELATLDLSEASDRVSNLLVTKLLSDHPHLLGAVMACRTKTADVLVNNAVSTVKLHKFASMGSALCFPIEAMVFATVIFVGIEKALNRPLSKKDLMSFNGKVRVYGDDIVVPTEFVHAVIESLEAYGFKVNTSKSFWRSNFRESCGKEYYAGQDVTLVRCRTLFPTSRQNVLEIVGVVSMRNQFYKAGLWKTAHYLDGIIERVIPFPFVSETSEVLGRISALGIESQEQHDDYQVPIVKGMKVVAKLPINVVDGPDALLKFFLGNNREIDPEVESRRPLRVIPPKDAEHLIRSGRPVRVDIKYRMGLA